MNAVARIGPNAITQCMAALAADLGSDGCALVMQRAGLGGHLRHPPTQMVDERDVVALHRAMRADLGVARARELSRIAGRATGDYLLAHRIPRLAQQLLLRLPAAMAARLLLMAITKHAWTFCGSGRFRVGPHRGVNRLVVSIEDCVTCRGLTSDEPLCDYYAATFERLFCVLVHPRAQVREVACAAMGAHACRFEIAW